MPERTRLEEVTLIFSQLNMAWRKELNREELRRQRGAHCMRTEKLPHMDMTTLADYIQVTLNVQHLQFVDHGSYFWWNVEILLPIMTYCV